jgi:hypothetical protein
MTYFFAEEDLVVYTAQINEPVDGNNSMTIEIEPNENESDMMNKDLLLIYNLFITPNKCSNFEE